MSKMRVSVILFRPNYFDLNCSKYQVQPTYEMNMHGSNKPSIDAIFEPNELSGLDWNIRLVTPECYHYQSSDIGGEIRIQILWHVKASSTAADKSQLHKKYRMEMSLSQYYHFLAKMEELNQSL